MRNLLLLPIAFVLLFLAYGYNRIAKEAVDPTRYANQIQQQVSKFETSILRTFEDEQFINKAINRAFSEVELSKLERLYELPYDLFIYKAPDSLVFWTSNRVLPFSTEIDFSPGLSAQYVTLKNGGYEIINQSYIYKNEQYALIGLIPIWKEYSIQNKYLQNGFALSLSIPDEVSLQFEPNDDPVKSITDKVMFYVSTNGNFADSRQQLIVLTLYLLGLGVLFFFFANIAERLQSSLNATVSMGFLALSIAAARYFTLRYAFTGQFSQLYLFQSLYFEESSIDSLGNLMIDAILTVWLAIYFYKRFKLPAVLQKNPTLGVITFYSFALLTGLLLKNVYQEMVLNTTISFGLDSLYSLDVYSTLGAMTFTLFSFAYFLFILKIDQLTKALEQPPRLVLGILLGTILAVTVLNLMGLLSETSFYAVSISAVLLIIAGIFGSSQYADFQWIVVWVGTFSILSAVLIFNFSQEKEINNQIFYANNLALERDLKTEELFKQVKNEIVEDHFIRRISNPFIPRNRIIEQIDAAHLKPYFENQYDYSVHLYTADSVGTKGEFIRYEDLSKYIDQGKKTASQNLFYWNNGKGQQYYIGRIPIKADNRRVYQILILFEPRTIERLSEYPELLIDERFEIQKKIKEYDYAIYKEGEKISEKNNNFTEKINFEIPEENNVILSRGNRNYLIHKASDGRLIIIGKNRETFTDAFSLFSYLFCLHLIVLVLLLLTNELLKSIRNNPFFDIAYSTSLRNKIQNNVVAIVVLAFVLIGVTTVVYFRAESEEYHSGRLGRKVSSLQASAKYQMEQNDSNLTFLPDIYALSEIHSMDINLFDIKGRLLASSQIDIFDKFFLSTRIQPVAYHALLALNKAQDYSTETIGTLNYRSAYLPIRTSENELVGFLGIPYYTEKENSRKDIGVFMGRLLNVYVGIFIIAGFLAYFQAKRITNPLEELSRKMKKVKVGQENERLQWDSTDEIGELIEEYNKMLGELERSALLLAHSERESAWREMAKQVAHEIKNPLTPMKLQIQFLQRAYKSNPENIEPLLKRVTYTLVEQIESLTRIASEFSAFAKMPVANNEVLVLNEMVESVYNLFSKQEDVEILLEMTEAECQVFADKDQLGRVLTNLTKNAIQAIPYDRSGVIKITLEKQGRRAVVKVMDNGSGISEDKQQKVFVPNFTTKSSGTGLGLAMAKNIVESAGGSIYFETQEDIGTTFYVELPLVKTTTPATL